MPKPSASLLRKANWAISNAADLVRKGELLDHCKHKQLRHTLLQMTTMFPVGACSCDFWLASSFLVIMMLFIVQARPLVYGNLPTLSL